MKLSSFKYDISPDLIAQNPLDNRDDSRLMVVDKDKGTIEHKMFKDVLDEFDEGDVFVANDTRVFPAKLYGNKEKTGIPRYLATSQRREAEILFAADSYFCICWNRTPIWSASSD